MLAVARKQKKSCGPKKTGNPTKIKHILRWVSCPRGQFFWFFCKRVPLICPQGAKNSKKWVPEGFKSRFDLLERWSSTRAFDWCALRHQSFDLRRVTAILLQQKNFGPNVIYYVFWESGGPSADDVDLEVDLKSTSGRPQVNLWYLPTHLTHLPQVDLKSTSGRLGSQPRRH